MLNLNNVTLTCVVGLTKFFEKSAIAVEESRAKCSFKKIKMFSCIPFRHPFVECIETKEFSYEDYNRFMIEGMNQYIDTDFILHIQYDGFILNPKAWDDKFLEYDYIGALWPVDLDDDPQVTESTRVGNGGFTLRSKKLLNILATKYKYDNSLSKYWNKPHNEDALICRKWRPELEKQGIKFAPPDVAAKFSIEYEHQKEYEGQTFKDVKSIKTFGFHYKNIKFNHE